MGRVLNSKERRALERISREDHDYVVKSRLPVGVGLKTLDGLVKMGLLETGPSKLYSGITGWKVAPDGWRCMYGKTYEEIVRCEMSSRPLRVWRWPSE